MFLDFLKLIRELIGVIAAALSLYITLRKAEKLRKKRNDLGKGHSH